MNKIVGIRFKPTGKTYDFECGAFVLGTGDHVIVETEQGLGFGTVVVGPMPGDMRPCRKTLKKVYRLATEKDFRQREKNLEDEKSAYAFCKKSIRELGLNMNLFSVEKSFDGSKIIFFFTAEGRVDFRQLVKILVKELGVRVEMRQVGIRNQAKMCGGIGRCGRELCCAAFLEKFEPVSIRMAKDQSLSLNPTKISGQCGRLMCCLTYENEVYQELKRDLPKIGKTVTTPNGKGKVVRHNALSNRITVRIDDGLEFDTGTDQITTDNEKD
jgi:cell fate regulator YaaT (PSP1 superfamily)